MNPGREMDAIVAEKVMGLKLKTPTCNGYWCEGEMHDSGCSLGGMAGFYRPAPYSTDISAAWQVVEKIRGRGRQVMIITPFEAEAFNYISRHKQWRVVIEDVRFRVDAICSYENGLPGNIAEADTAPHAICLAALKAVGVEDGRPVSAV